MKRRLLSLFLILCLLGAVCVSAAESHPPRVVDDADLLTFEQERELTEKLDAISQRQEVDVAVITVESLDGKSPMAYADDYFDYNGYGMGPDDDGILLLVAMESRDWWITTHGFGITALTDAGIDYIGEQIVGDLGNGYYADAFSIFADHCDDFLTQAKNGMPYDNGHMPKEPFDAGGTLMSSLIVGLVVAVIVIAVFRGQLKSVKGQRAASAYVVGGSLDVTETGELFLYRNIHRTKRETSSSGGSSTHTSSSGRSHGGGGGKF